MELATWTKADVGKTRMWVQEVSCGVLSWDVCMFKVVLRPNTEPVDTESDGKHRGRRESGGSINSVAKDENETLSGNPCHNPVI